MVQLNSWQRRCQPWGFHHYRRVQKLRIRELHPTCCNSPLDEWGSRSWQTKTVISKNQHGQALHDQLKAGASLADYTGILGTQKDIKVFRCTCTKICPLFTSYQQILHIQRKKQQLPPKNPQKNPKTPSQPPPPNHPTKTKKYST